MVANKRIFYAIYAAAIAIDGGTSFTAIHGLQSIGMNTRFNLESVFEIGQVDEYSSVEDVPDIEITTEKVIDGYPLVYHLATNGSTDATLVGRSVKRSQLAISYFGDSQTAASGTPIKQVVCSGLFCSSLTYSFPVQGNFTESVTLVCNDKNWLSSGFTFTGGFNNTDTPPSGIQRRQHMLFGSGAGKTVLPYELPGMTNFGGSGFNLAQTDGSNSSHVQSIRTSCNLGRTPLYELGKRTPYHRSVDFPVEVRTDIEMYCSNGDTINAAGETTNVTTQPIWIRISDGSIFNLGTKNKLISISETGGNASTGGGNRSITYTYRNFSNLTVTSPADPSLL